MFGSVILLFLTLYITRSISVDAYGEAKLILNVVSITLVLFMLGRENILVLEYQRKGDIILSGELFFTILTLILLTFITVVSIYFFDEPRGLSWYIGFMMVPLWGAFNIINAALRATNKINESFFISNLLQRILRFFVVILTLFFYPSTYGVVLGYVLSQMLLVFISFYILINSFKFEFKTINFKRYRKTYNESLIFGFTALTSVLMIHLDSLMLGWLSPIRNVGLYDIAYSLSIFTMYPLLALIKTTEASAMTLLKDISKMSNYNDNLNISVIISVVISIFFICFGYPVLSLFGPDYVDIYFAMVILTTGFTTLIFFGVSNEYLLWNNNKAIVLIISVLAISLNIVINYYAIPEYAGVGASIASISCLLFSKLCCFIICKFKYDVKLSIPIFKMIIYTLGFYTVFMIVNNMSHDLTLLPYNGGLFLLSMSSVLCLNFKDVKKVFSV